MNGSIPNTALLLAETRKTYRFVMKFCKHCVVGDSSLGWHREVRCRRAAFRVVSLGSGRTSAAGKEASSSLADRVEWRRVQRNRFNQAQFLEGRVQKLQTTSRVSVCWEEAR